VENILLTLWFFIIGIVIGSFLNVCIYRIPEGKSIVIPVYSFCPHCKNKIHWYDNVPILSFIFLQGRCRHCNNKISLRYPVVELISGIVTVLNFYVFEFSFEFYHSTVFFYFLIVLSFIDIEKGIIPRTISLFGILCAVALGILGSEISVVTIFLGGVLGGVLIIILGLLGKLIFKRESMGGGDVFLAMLIGFFIGYRNVFLSIWFGFLLAFVFILGYIVWTKRITGRIKFGPFLSLGAVVSVFYGNQLVEWYFNLI